MVPCILFNSSYKTVPQILNEKNEEFENKRPQYKIRIFLIRISFYALKSLLVTAVLFYVGIPVIFKYCSPFRRIFVFGTMVDVPACNNYSDLEAFGLNGARNFYLEHNGIKIGLWHILPSYLAINEVNDSNFEEFLTEKSDVLLYNHGNTGSRATSYRLDLYEVLRKKFHVIAYDYRGFGDSTGDPRTQNDVIEDGIFVAHWLLGKLNSKARFFLWGHSLGSTVALAITTALKNENIIPTGLFLESSYHNGREAISSTPTCRLFSFLPWFDMCIIDPIMKNEGSFSNYEYISNIDCPLLILHSEDDNTISYKYGEKLYQEASKKRSNTQETIEFALFSGKYKCGHNHISKAPNFPVIVENFIKKSVNSTNEQAWND